MKFSLRSISNPKCSIEFLPTIILLILLLLDLSLVPRLPNFSMHVESGDEAEHMYMYNT